MERISRALLLCFVFHSLLLNQAFALEENGESSTHENCIVRDGRDGVPGPPGVPGRSGSPGRDGRDCSVNWSINRVFDMEKRLRDLDSKCQFMVKTTEEMKKEMEASKQQAQQLLKILAAKNILDKDNTIRETTYDLIPTPGEALTKQPATELIQPTTRKPATSPHIYSSSPQPITIGNANKNCQERKKRLVFHVHGQVETRGGVNMEIFHIKENTFLAVANFHSSLDDSYNTDSFIYKMNPKTEKFEFLQALPTIGCRSMTYFSDRGASYLVALNHFDGKTHALNSVIYKWNGNQFENFTVVPTSGGSAAQFFQIDGESFLAFANYRNSTSVSIFSVVYKWNHGKVEVFQNLQTHGAVDCKFYRTKAGEMFLVFANYYSLKEKFNAKSVVYKWNGRRFVFVQNVEASAGIGVDLFEGKERLFLVLASHRTASSWHSHTNVFQWNGTAFVLFQELETSAAIKVHHFQADGKLYLTIANYFDEITSFKTHSMVYIFKENGFIKFQGILTTGAYDLQPFTYRGFPYLAAAFRFNGETGSLKSKIYKMYNGCVAREDALP